MPPRVVLVTLLMLAAHPAAKPVFASLVGRTCFEDVASLSQMGCWVMCSLVWVVVGAVELQVFVELVVVSGMPSRVVLCNAELLCLALVYTTASRWGRM